MKRFTTWLFYLTAMVAFARPACATTILYFTGSPTSWVSAGKTWSLSEATGYTISAFRYFNQGEGTNSIHFFFQKSSNQELWSLDFIGSHYSLPVVGSYQNAIRYPFQGTLNGLSLHGDGRGDNTLKGNFTVLESVFDSAGNLLKYAADFTQYDEGILSKWNVGSIRYNSDIPITPVPEPSTITLLAIGGIGLLVGRRLQYTA